MAALHENYNSFRRVFTLDTEFRAAPGGLPEPVSLVTKELRSGETCRYFEDDLARIKTAPFPLTEDTLAIGFYTSAEWGFFKALGWECPSRIIDLYAEFRCCTSGLYLPNGHSLLGALLYYGLDAMAAEEKEEMRNLIQRGGPWTSDERLAILDYNESDVTSTERLFHKMEATIDVPRAIYRGMYWPAVADMEWTGIHIDADLLGQLVEYQEQIALALIRQYDVDGLYEDTTLKRSRFRQWVNARDLPWPCTATGQLATDEETFSRMAEYYPVVKPYKDLNAWLSSLRLSELPIGPDSRNRCLLSPFGSITGRNQPRVSQFFYARPKWLRPLVLPREGHTLIMCDYEQQEIVNAAYLAGDQAMIRDCLAGDIYIAFGKRAGLIPMNATKEDVHPLLRKKLKETVLGTNYGLSARSLARKLGITVQEAEKLQMFLACTYPVFWSWRESMIATAQFGQTFRTIFGWEWHPQLNSLNERTALNWQAQAAGAEMLRLLCCLLYHQGIHISAPVHDAVLIEVANDRVAEVEARVKAAMGQASNTILNGGVARTKIDRFTYPNRCADEGGKGQWNSVMNMLRQVQTKTYPRL